MINLIPEERGILAGLYKYGTDALIEISPFINSESFTVETNQVIYRLFLHILKDEDSKIDTASIFAAANQLGVNHIIEKPEEKKVLRAIMNFDIDIRNIVRMAAKIRKLQIASLLQKQLTKANKSLDGVTGDEPIREILGIAENTVLDFSSLLIDSQEEGPQLIGKDILEYVNHLATNPVNIVGISSGMPEFDRSIGGGFRDGTVSIVGARPKMGKSMLANNVACFVARNLNVPVLYLDTEMSKDIHVQRMLANISDVTIDDIEHGQFANHYEKVRNAAKQVSEIPYHYQSIVGMPFEDTISLMRRWKKRHVKDGQRCLIIYDYLKLMSAEGISKDLKEHQILGFQMTSLHNFMAKHNAAGFALIQLNRDGIEKEDTSVASGSDRIIWLCSNFSVYKKLSPSEQAEHISAGIKRGGNRKIVPIVTRYGAGLEDDDYICVQSQYQFGRIVELGTRKGLEGQTVQNSGEIEYGTPEETAGF